MEENGAKYMGQLGGSGGEIQTALDALKQKKSSVDQVELHKLLLRQLLFARIDS